MTKLFIYLTLLIHFNNLKIFSNSYNKINSELYVAHIYFLHKYLKALNRITISETNTKNTVTLLYIDHLSSVFLPIQADYFIWEKCYFHY